MSPSDPTPLDGMSLSDLLAERARLGAEVNDIQGQLAERQHREDAATDRWRAKARYAKRKIEQELALVNVRILKRQGNDDAALIVRLYAIVRRFVADELLIGAERQAVAAAHARVTELAARSVRT